MRNLTSVTNFKKTKVFTISNTISLDKFESVASLTYPVLRNYLFCIRQITSLNLCLDSK